MARLKLSELEREIVKQLNEAGAEELLVVVNSLFEDAATRRTSLDEIRSALGHLHQHSLIKFVYCVPDYPSATRREAEEILALDHWLEWQKLGGYWTSKREWPFGPIGIAIKE